jgi:hypothetical protein
MDTAIEPDIMALVFTILKRFNHPFILVGQAAHRWMGCGGCVDDAIDLLLRDDQLGLIAAAFIHSGYWSLFDAQFKRGNYKTGFLKSELEDHEKHQQRKELEEFQKPENDEKSEVDTFLSYCRDADGVLRLTIETNQKWPFNHIRLWSEQTFRLKVDGPLWIEIPALFYGQSLLAENDFHPTTDRTDGWFFGPALLSHYDNRLITVGEVKDNNLFIPSIPSYLDALVYHATRYSKIKPSLAFISQWQIRNLTRYLYLELPKRRIQILFEVEADTERFLENYLNNYKRKPYYVLSKKGELVLVERHRPESFPELFQDLPRSLA